MIVFFANNVASRHYFTKLMGFVGDARLYNDSALSLLSLTAFFQAPAAVIERQISYLDREHQILAGKPLSSLKRFVLAMQARWFFARDCHFLIRHQPSLVVVWNGLMFRRSFFVAAARAQGIPCCFMENGLLPNTTVLDRKGINAVNSMPRDADFYRQRSAETVDKPVSLVAREAKVPKKSSGKALPEKFIFVPFQVDTDSQIIIFSDWIRDMRQLFSEIHEVAPHLAGYRFVFKEHPSSPIDYRHLHPALPESMGMFANDYPTQELIEKSAAVITVNSTVGIEALLFGKKVIVLGEAFYNIPGLVLAANNRQQLVSALHSLEAFTPDETLRQNFLHYLEHDYLVQGSWRQAETAHCQEVAGRLHAIVAETALAETALTRG